MAKQSINTIKQWFKTSLKPTQQQFWDWLDSFRHKDDKVQPDEVDGLQNLLDAKVDKKDVVEPEVWDNTKAYVYDAETQQYVSFQNAASENLQFKVEGFYRLLADTAAGESPESHPAKWAYQGQTIGEITIGDIQGLTEALGNKIETSEKGANNGVATLGGDGKLTASQLPEIQSGGSADLLRLSENPTYNAGGSVKIIKYSYVSDPTKYYEERFAYANGLATKIEIKDDIAATWIQKTDIYNGSGQLQKPTIATITAWTIT
jgi:hypothetical protein